MQTTGRQYLSFGVLAPLHDAASNLVLLKAAKELIYFLNLIAVLGAVRLVGAAAVVPFRPHVAAKIGHAGSVLLRVYYAPLIAVSIVKPFSTWHSIRFFISFHDYVPVAGILVGPILLIASTASPVLFFKAKSLSSSGNQGFPHDNTRTSQNSSVTSDDPVRIRRERHFWGSAAGEEMTGCFVNSTPMTIAFRI